MQGIKRKIVYVVSFELLAIVLASTLLRLLSESPLVTAGITAVASSTIAMAWNFVYNLLFEKWEARRGRRGRSLLLRAAHATGFELGLVTMLVPLFAWVLGVSLLTALLLNAVMIVFFLVYGCQGAAGKRGDRDRHEAVSRAEMRRRLQARPGIAPNKSRV